MNKNKKEQFLGLLRELLTAGGALFFGAFTGLPAVIGLAVAIAAIAWGIYHHEGVGILETSIRKALSALPGFLLAFGWISADAAPQLLAFITPLFSLIWSFNVNGSSSVTTDDSKTDSE